MTGRRGSGPGIVRRHLLAARGPAGLLAALALLATLLVAAVPGTFDAIGAAELHHQIDQLAVPQRFLTTRIVTPPPLGPAPLTSPPPDGLPAADVDVWGGLDSALSGIVASAPLPLRATLGQPHYTVVSDPVGLSEPVGAPVAELHLALAADPRVDSLIAYTDGRPPHPDHYEFTAAAPLEVALSVQSAAALGWRVGQTRQLAVGDRRRHFATLAGTFVAAPDSDAHWALTPNILLPQIVQTPDTEIRVGTAYVEAASWPLAAELTGGGQTLVDIPFSAATLRSADVQTVQQQLDIFTAAAHPLSGPADAIPVRLRSGTAEVLAGVQASTASARAVLAVLAIGPCGAALAVYVLGCRLLAARRRPAYRLLSTRGWSDPGLQLLLAAEGALLSAPAVLAAALLVRWLLPPDRPVGLTVAAGAMLLGCPLLLATAALRRNPVARRTDLSARSGRWRFLGELLVVGLAVAAALLLYTTGARRSAGGTDPLVVAAPLLLCLAASVLVNRVYPVPLAALVRVFRRRRDLTSFLGPARALRAPAGGVVAVLALVVGVAMAVLSGVLFSTLDTGIATASRSTVGADLRVDGTAIPAAAVQRVRALPDVRTVAAVIELDSVAVTVSGVEQAVTVYLVDGPELGSVQSGVTGAVGLPRGGLASAPGLPVVVSADLAAQLAASARPALAAAGRPLTVAGTSATAAGLARGSGWIVADRALLPTFGGDVVTPDELLIALRPGADPMAAEVAVTAAVGSAGAVTTAAAVRARLSAAPVISGVHTVVLAALLLMAALSALAIALLAVDSAPARRRLLGLLQILGMDSSAGRGLTAWELAPQAVAALLGGGVLGVGLAWVVTGAVDLRPFTGGLSAPAVTVGAATMVAVVGGYAAVVTVATLLGSWFARRVSPAVLVRFGE